VTPRDDARGNGPADAGWQTLPPVPPSTLARLSSNAEVLNWQSRIRILVASTAAVAVLLMLAGNPADFVLSAVNPVTTVLLATEAYVLLAVVAGSIARRRASAHEWLVGATVLGDVGFVFAVTIAISQPQYYDRILIIAFLVFHLNTFYFGRRHAAIALLATVLGYAVLVDRSIASGAALHWREELWSVAAFVLAGAVLLVEQGRLRNRLATLVHLFGRAEEGDFTESYDDRADTRPDAITRVGRAYNRVRGQLASMVLSDPLTGCVNRRGFEQTLTREVARATRAGSELALLALDVDHFKTVNDTLGHLAGDFVLREVGALLLHTARAGDVVARTGGEEFSIVLPDTSAAGAYQVATRLCEVIREHRFVDGARGARLTVSIGVVAADTRITGSIAGIAETLKGRADDALYAAKRGGRDRVRSWVEEEEDALVLGV
jgi:diguanylate cyclase (GGDEF)-like protein